MYVEGGVWNVQIQQNHYLKNGDPRETHVKEILLCFHNQVTCNKFVMGNSWATLTYMMENNQQVNIFRG